MSKSIRKKSKSIGTYRVVGVMSGSSLDGLDLALCELKYARGKWIWRIEKARTIPYPPRIQEALEHVMTGNAFALAVVDTELGEFIGEKCKRFAGGKADRSAVTDTPFSTCHAVRLPSRSVPAGPSRP
ncbi:MAG: anhydro-N-acetylmuramic acid kinase [Flavobacteriales bacterium]|nr:anhydro-N-acetylmuramic acid kinase [Flavobacteriales bacterium]